MSKLELKAAMDSLQVKIPLRLSTRVPSFTPPEIDQTLVGNNTQIVNPTYFKDIEIYLNKNIKINNTLPLTPSHEAIEQYFSGRLPEKRRERDLKAFEKLKYTFTKKEIENALGFVLKEGTLGAKEKPYSPWDYLLYAMPEVLKKIKEKEALLDKKKQEIALKKEHEKNILEKEKKEDEKFLEQEKAFTKAFSDEKSQKAVIEKYSKKLLFINPQSSIARSLTISAWHEEDSKKEAALS